MVKATIERVFVVTQGPRVVAVYTSKDRMFDSIDIEIDLVVCRPPEVGWNGLGRHADVRIRSVPLDTWGGLIRWAWAGDIEEE